MNVWTPDDADNFPVMVWIHGGGLTSGSAHQPYYIGDQLAARGVVLVSMNYRLGPLGFLTTDELIAEADGESFGNYGLADQVAALEWVQSNIAGFGGNPNQVTLFGESAGGFSICGHLASPQSDGLFQQAIIQSGGGCSRSADPDAASVSGETLLDSLGCVDIACARALPADVLGAAAFNAQLTADNVALTSPAIELAEDGAFPDVTVMTGFNADEATLFTLGSDEPDDAELRALVGAFTSDPEALIGLYPPADYETNLARYQAIWTDVTFGCPAIDFAATVPNTYTYHFTYVSAANPFGLGATHGAELAFVFGHPEGIIGLADAFDPESIDVSGAIQQAWVEFAATGSPGADWPSDDEAGRIMVLDNPFELVDTIRNNRCTTVTALTGGDLDD